MTITSSVSHPVLPQENIRDEVAQGTPMTNVSSGDSLNLVLTEHLLSSVSNTYSHAPNSSTPSLENLNLREIDSKVEPTDGSLLNNIESQPNLSRILHSNSFNPAFSSGTVVIPLTNSTQSLLWALDLVDAEAIRTFFDSTNDQNITLHSGQTHGESCFHDSLNTGDISFNLRPTSTSITMISTKKSSSLSSSSNLNYSRDRQEKTTIIEISQHRLLSHQNHSIDPLSAKAVSSEDTDFNNYVDMLDTIFDYQEVTSLDPNTTQKSQLINYLPILAASKITQNYTNLSPKNFVSTLRGLLNTLLYVTDHKPDLEPNLTLKDFYSSHHLAIVVEALQTILKSTDNHGFQLMLDNAIIEAVVARLMPFKLQRSVDYANSTDSSNRSFLSHHKPSSDMNTPLVSNTSPSDITFFTNLFILSQHQDPELPNETFAPDFARAPVVDQACSPRQVFNSSPPTHSSLLGQTNFTKSSHETNSEYSTLTTPLPLKDLVQKLNNIANLPPFQSTEFYDRAIQFAASAVLSSTKVCKAFVDWDAIDLFVFPLLDPPSANSDAHFPIPIVYESATKVAAAIAVAAISNWSGPRHALQVCDTPFFSDAVANVLRNKDDYFPDAVIASVLSGLTLLSKRAKARKFFIDAHCDELITELAKKSAQNRNYKLAAKASFCAGHIRGVSIDRFGFFVTGLADVDPDKDNITTNEHSLSSQNQSHSFNSTRNATPSHPLSPLENSKAPNLHRKIDTQIHSPIPEHYATAQDTVEKDLSSLRNFYFNMDSHSKNNRESFAFRKTLLSTDNLEAYRDVRKTQEYISFADSSTSGEIEGTDFTHQELVRKWEAAILNPSLLKEDSSSRATYRKLSRFGIPSSVRSKVWPILLRIKELDQESPNLFHHHSHQAVDEKTELTIVNDVTRTMPMHELFWAGGAAIGIESLKTILKAYASYDPSVGYCQGMSSVAAMFLMNGNNENESFLMFVQFMQLFKYTEIFRPGFPLMFQWIEEFEYLCERYVYIVSKKLSKLEIHANMFADKWFLTALTYNFPHEAIFRLWDIMFTTGSTKIIMRAALAVLKLSKGYLMKMEYDEIIMYLQRGFANPETGILDDVDAFIDCTKTFKIRRKQQQLRAVEEMTGFRSVRTFLKDSKYKMARKIHFTGSCFHP